MKRTQRAAKPTRPASEIDPSLDPRMRKALSLLSDVMHTDIDAGKFARVKRMCVAAIGVLEAFTPRVDFNDGEDDGIAEYQMARPVMRQAQGVVMHGGLALAHAGPEDQLRTLLGHLSGAMDASRANELSSLLRSLESAQRLNRPELVAAIEKRLGEVDIARSQEPAGAGSRQVPS
jgi:hypothetical protein